LLVGLKRNFGRFFPIVSDHHLLGNVVFVEQVVHTLHPHEVPDFPGVRDGEQAQRLQDVGFAGVWLPDEEVNRRQSIWRCRMDLKFWISSVWIMKGGSSGLKLGYPQHPGLHRF
jgi:hypothetical protein